MIIFSSYAKVLVLVCFIVTLRAFINPKISYGIVNSRNAFVMNSDNGSKRDLRTILSQAQDEDAQWLQSVLGESLVKQMTGSSADAIIDESEAQQNNQEAKSKQPVVDDAQFKRLSSLGYTLDDIESIKGSALRIIMERSIARPRSGLPPSWLTTASPEPSSASSKQPSTIDSSPRRRPSKGARERVDRVNVLSGGANAGESFSWRSKGLSPEELADRDRVLRKDRSGSAPRRSSDYSNYASSSPSKPSSMLTSDAPPDGPTTFWPDLDEFKDMLLTESQWRVDLLGNWLTPFVKDEAKWRYILYKKWLTLLDEGLGDGFDVVEDAFEEEEYGDMDYYDEDERSMGGVEFDEDESYEPRARPSPSASSPLPRPRPSSTGTPGSRSRNSDRSSAAAYDARLRSSIPSTLKSSTATNSGGQQTSGGDSDWTDLRSEQEFSRREMAEVQRGLRESIESGRIGRAVLRDRGYAAGSQSARSARERRVKRPSREWFDDQDDEPRSRDERNYSGDDLEGFDDWDLEEPPSRSRDSEAGRSTRRSTRTSSASTSPAASEEKITEEEFRRAWEASSRRDPIDSEDD